METYAPLEAVDLTGAAVSTAVEVPIEKLKAMYPVVRASELPRGAVPKVSRVKVREDLGKCPVCQSDLIVWGSGKRCVACARNF